MTDELLVMALGRNRMDPADLLKRGGNLVLEIAHERLDGGKPHITGGRAIATILLNVLQEGHDHRCVQVFDGEQRRTRAEPFGCEVEQQLEAERVCLAALRAVTSLSRHIISQEASDERGELRHKPSSPTRVSAAAAMSVIMSGVASRYQYVLWILTWPR